MRYEDIYIGQKETLTHIITLDDMNKFVQLTGDDNKLHVDEKFASNTVFKKPVVHGMLGASFISTIIGTKIPGDGALWFSQSLEFLLPVRIGDELRVVAEVIKKNDKENIIELKTDIYNQNRQIVTKGFAKVKVVELIDSTTLLTIEDDAIKTAMVIGGTGGIGAATCLQLAKDGFNVAIHYNKNKHKAEAIKLDIEALGKRAIILNGDILNDYEVKEMVTKTIRAYNKIDVVINCAASPIPNIKFQDLQWTDYLKQLELNIKSTFSIIKEIVPLMIENKYGKIISLGSLAADKPNSEWSHYITSKAALVGFTRSLALELAPKGIRVNLVTPSLVSTELTADVPEKIKLLTAAQTPLRRLALVNDVANAICFLASEKSNFITGENIRVNGGQVML